MVFQRYQYGLHSELGQNGLLLGRPRFANHVKRALNKNQHFYDGMVQTNIGSGLLDRGHNFRSFSKRNQFKIIYRFKVMTKLLKLSI